jgi:hypothetical protein
MPTRPVVPRRARAVGLVALGAAAAVVVPNLLGGGQPDDGADRAAPADTMTRGVIDRALADPALADVPFPVTAPPYLDLVTNLGTVDDGGTMGVYQSAPMSVVVCDVPAASAERCTDGWVTIREVAAEGRLTLVQVPAWVAALHPDPDDPAQVARDWVQDFWLTVPLDRGDPPAWVVAMSSGGDAASAR